jgi:divalent metal cation (Fe/Co/Zn/Cd) transporter
LKAIAISFFALAIYVTGEAAGMFLTGASPETSRTGIVLAAISLAVMPVLSAAQRGAGREPGSAGAVADSRQTSLCTYLSAVLPAGLLLNAVFGWWWADPGVALAIAAVARKQGRTAWRGQHCC